MKWISSTLVLIILLSGAGWCRNLTIEQCILMAHQRNLNLKRQLSELQINTLREEKAKKYFLPSISSEAEFANKTYESDNTVKGYNYYQIELLQPIYHFGELQYRLDFNRSLKFVSLLELVDTSILVERDVILAYLNVLRLKKQKSHTLNTLHKAEIQLEEIKQKVAEGKQDQKSLSRWQVLIDQYKDRLVSIDTDLADTYTTMRKLLEWESSIDDVHITPIELTEEYEYDLKQISENEIEYTQTQREGVLFDYAQTFCPALQRRGYEVKAAESALALERANNMPKVDFAPKLKQEDDTNRAYWMLGVKARFAFLNLPDWENVSIRKEELTRTKLDRDIFWRDRRASIRSTYFQFNNAVKKLVILIRASEDSATYIHKMHEAYSKGSITDVELIDAFNAFYGANQARIDALYSFFGLREQLYYLIGHSEIFQSPSVDRFMKMKNIKEVYTQKDIYYDYFFLSDMVTAVKKNDVEKARQLVRTYRGLIGKSAFMKWTVTHFAAFFGNARMVEERLKEGKDANAMTITDSTPLYLAAEQGHKEVVEVLLRYKANPNIQSEMEKWTPLMRASTRGYEDICDMLIKGGADVNLKSNLGRTALHTAAEQGFTDIVKMLITAGADVNAKTNSGNTALDLARREGYFELADFLTPLTMQDVEKKK
jgi:outer membrane protein TolC